MQKKRIKKIIITISCCFLSISQATASPLSIKNISDTASTQKAVLLTPEVGNATISDFIYQPLTQDELSANEKELILKAYGGVRVEVSDALNMRSSPIDGSVIRYLYNGTVCKLLDIEDDWYKVSVGNKVGYIKAEYTSLVPTAEFEEIFVTSCTVDNLVADALTWIGTKYKIGGYSKSGTDCSGFTMAVFSVYGVYLEHGAQNQYRVSKTVTTEERKTGDLVFFSSNSIPDGIAHVGIYLGNGEFIHASSSSGVIISSLYETYYAKHYIGAGRVLDS